MSNLKSIIQYSHVQVQIYFMKLRNIHLLL